MEQVSQCHSTNFFCKSTQLSSRSLQVLVDGEDDNPEPLDLANFSRNCVDGQNSLFRILAIYGGFS
jgi:hypothetical protein